MTDGQRATLAKWMARSKYDRAATVAEVLPAIEMIVTLWLGSRGASETEERESMTPERFETVCGATLALLARQGYAKPERCPGLESAPAHLAWMLAHAAVFYFEGRVQKANRWLGYVQGSMHADGYATVEELKRANMPEGEAFDREKK